MTVSHPGSDPYPSSLTKQLADEAKRRPASYVPRTKHIKDGKPTFTNRLFLESSPYLNQHAHNPVNWYPWGEEAFEAARKLKRPIFLSIGYATCHWCHVMEEESFEDLEIAEFLNKNYIAVKVDREERPDIDAIYMVAVQAMTGGGGWPMSVWLDSDGKPFYGGTYFPARDGDRGSGIGFLTILQKLASVYREDPKRVKESSEELIKAIKTQLEAKSTKKPIPPDLTEKLLKFYKAQFDETYGGLARPPKFPSSLPVRLLLSYYRNSGDKKALSMATKTLDQMAMGGIYDQVGGGFHRYSVDEAWLVPHFEKMLYDNAQLVIAYLEGYQLTKDPHYKRVVEQTLDYVGREMRSKEGSFYSATDADSPNPDKKGEREEGWFFTWTPSELRKLLSTKEEKVVTSYYNVTAKGNFEGRNILHRLKTDKEAAKDLKLDVKVMRQHLDSAHAKLYSHRLTRPKPILDDKVLTAWNAQMISGFARAGFVLKRPDYLEIARKAASFITDKMLVKGRLLRTYKDGRAKLNGYLDDHAFFIAALLDLYEADFDLKWLKQAIQLDQTLAKYFEDEQGGFFQTSSDHEKLLVREKPTYDGAIPSGNSIALLNLLRLAEMTAEKIYSQRAQKALDALSEKLVESPMALTDGIYAMEFQKNKPKEIVIVAPKAVSDAEPFLQELRDRFLPEKVVVVVAQGEVEAAAKVLPLVGGKKARQDQPTAYVCENHVCKFPTNDLEKFRELIDASH